MTGIIRHLQGCRVARTLCAADGTVNWYDHFAHPVTEQSHFWVCGQGKHVHICAKKACIRMFTEALAIITHIWKLSTVPEH